METNPSYIIAQNGSINFESYESRHNKRFCSTKEREEQKGKEKEREDLYTIIRVSCDENLYSQIGKIIFFDLVNHDTVSSFCVKNKTSFSLFQEEVAKELGIPVQYQRFWCWAERVNKTYRPYRPLHPEQASYPVEDLRGLNLLNKGNDAEVNLFLEIELEKDARPIPPPDITKENILLFFKLYDPLKEELSFAGRFFVNVTGKPTEILTKLNELAGFEPDEELELFEEIRLEPVVMCEYVDKNLTFRESLLDNGDIICYQKRLEVQTEKCRYPDVPSFLQYVGNSKVVRFRSLEKPTEDEFVLEMSKLDKYDDVVDRVASHLHLVDSSKIRLTSYSYDSQQPKASSIKYGEVDNLLDMLTHNSQISDILFYEVLDIPLPELQGLKTLNVYFHHATKDEVAKHSVRLPKHSTVSDLLNYLKSRVELSHNDAELRLLEVFNHKIYKIFPVNDKIEDMDDQSGTLRVEEIPDDQKDLGPTERIMNVYHFKKHIENQGQIQSFGDPFLLVVRDGEKVAETKVHIQKKLQVPDEEFSKWKFVYVSFDNVAYLRDTDIVSVRSQSNNAYCYGAFEHNLGLEHSNSSS